MKFAILYGSYREPRLGIRAARYVLKKCRDRGHDAHLIDAKEYNVPMLDRMHKDFEKGKAPENLEKISRILGEADAFIFISGEYNNGLQPGLKNLIDHFFAEYDYKPSGIVSYSNGNFAGITAAAALKLTLIRIGTICIPANVPISRIQESFDEEGKLLDPAIEARFEKFIKELEWYAQALETQRDMGLPK